MISWIYKPIFFTSKSAGKTSVVLVLKRILMQVTRWAWLVCISFLDDVIFDNRAIAVGGSNKAILLLKKNIVTHVHVFLLRCYTPKSSRWHCIKTIHCPWHRIDKSRFRMIYKHATLILDLFIVYPSSFHCWIVIN